MPHKLTSKNNFAFLTVALLLLLLSSALVEQFASGTGRVLIMSATVVTLGVGVWSIRSARHWFHSGIGFLVLILLVTLTTELLDYAGLRYLYLFGMFGYFTVTAWLALKQVFGPGRVDGNRIVGALCLYLLIGMIWAMLYLLAATLSVESFRGIDTTDPYSNFSGLMYFSFVTLTTLGYGDITPVLPLPRVLVYFEAIVGQFYLAVLVAGLVGMRFSAQDRAESNDPGRQGG